MESELQGDVRDRGSFPQAAAMHHEQTWGFHMSCTETWECPKSLRSAGMKRLECHERKRGIFSD